MFRVFRNIAVLITVLMLFSCDGNKVIPKNDEESVVDEDSFVDETQDIDVVEETDDEVAGDSDFTDDLVDIDEEGSEIDNEVADEVDEVPDVDDVSNDTCMYLFGNPTEKTGLTTDQCKPFFNCEGIQFQAPVYSEAETDWIESRVYLNPPDEMMSNPYDNPENYPNYPEKFCGIKFKDDQKLEYSLYTYDSTEALTQDGAQITHAGACGHCSSLQSLAVYIKEGDLAGPVRSCTTSGIIQSEEKTMECLMEIGFDRLCAKVWYYNTKNTTSKCILKCYDDFTSVYHLPDGTLNDCIQCDEDESGPVFKATSGRTRRNSGLPTALCRPCNTVSRVKHHYQ